VAPLTGGTAVCAPAPERRQNSLPLTDSFFDLCKFSGIGSMEYKYDRRFGKFLWSSDRWPNRLSGGGLQLSTA